MDVKSELDAKHSEARETKAQSNSTLQQVQSELHTTKLSLEETRIREKQVKSNNRHLVFIRIVI